MIKNCRFSGMIALMLVLVTILGACTSVNQDGKYKVAFNVMGGEKIQPLYLEEDAWLILPIPQRQDYLFAGWYSNRNLSTLFEESKMMRGNITLYAKWIHLIDAQNIFYSKLLDEDENQITLQVKITGKVQLSGFMIDILYPSENLSIDQVENHLSTVTNPDEPGRIRVNFVDVAHSLRSDTNIMTITFNKRVRASSIIGINVIESIRVNQTGEVEDAVNTAAFFRINP